MRTDSPAVSMSTHPTGIIWPAVNACPATPAALHCKQLLRNAILAVSTRAYLPPPHKPITHLIDWFQVHQLFCLEPGVFRPVAALTAVVAVLRAPTSFDAQQRAALDLATQHSTAQRSQARHNQDSVL
jgi:hypothetical protein